MNTNEFREWRDNVGVACFCVMIACGDSEPPALCLLFAPFVLVIAALTWCERRARN